MGATPIVELSHVTFAYPSNGAARPASFSLADVSFSVAPGEILGVIGPNSAGKTTLVRLLTGVRAPDRGTVRFEGEPLSRLTRRALARHVALVPQELPDSFPFTVEELVLMGRYPHGAGRFFETAEDDIVAREAMAAAGVLALRRAPLTALSGGERQRAVLARALAQRPALLVLDEPTAHLDLRHQAASIALLRRLNRERGTTIVMISHDLNLVAEVSDRVLVLAGGRLLADGPPERVLEAGLLEAAFGCTIVVDKSPATGRPIIQVAWSDETIERR